MKKLFSIVLILALAVSACICPASAEQVQVMTSFYPIYIFALNVFDGVEGVDVSCMTAPTTGCLHDYQLLASDMMRLADSDVLIVCGAGMENYLSDVTEQLTDLPVIDCSQGIELLEEGAHSHHDEEEHHDGDEEEESVNAHTWLDAGNAIKIVQTITDESVKLFPEYAEKIQENAAAYVQKLAELDEKIREMLAPYEGRSIVTFHEAFPYFAKAYGLNIAAVITEEHEDSLSPKQIYEVIDTVIAAGLPPLFTEPQYASKAAQTIAEETGAKLFELDPIVTGEAEMDTYEVRMLKNAETLIEAFSD